jgi:hypothetical protein
VREAWEKNKSGAKSGPAQHKKWLDAVDFVKDVLRPLDTKIYCF